MKKHKFRDDDGMAKCCVNDCNMTTKEKIRDEENSLIRLKERLKSCNKEMESLSIMQRNYKYRQTTINELIGICYIDTCVTFEDIKLSKKKLKQLRKEDK